LLTFSNKNNWKLFQKSIILSIKSITKLSTYLLNNKNYTINMFWLIDLRKIASKIYFQYSLVKKFRWNYSKFWKICWNFAEIIPRCWKFAEISLKVNFSANILKNHWNTTEISLIFSEVSLLKFLLKFVWKFCWFFIILSKMNFSAKNCWN